MGPFGVTAIHFSEIHFSCIAKCRLWSHGVVCSCNGSPMGAKVSLLFRYSSGFRWRYVDSCLQLQESWLHASSSLEHKEVNKSIALLLLCLHGLTLHSSIPLILTFIHSFDGEGAWGRTTGLFAIS